MRNKFKKPGKPRETAEIDKPLLDKVKQVQWTGAFGAGYNILLVCVGFLIAALAVMILVVSYKLYQMDVNSAEELIKFLKAIKGIVGEATPYQGK